MVKVVSETKRIFPGREPGRPDGGGFMHTVLQLNSVCVCVCVCMGRNWEEGKLDHSLCKTLEFYYSKEHFNPRMHS